MSAVRVARVHWRTAIKSPAFPAELRSIGRTLLLVFDLMTADGVLFRWRDEIGDAAGLPLRTTDRHLARAVAAGWLIHAKPHGGNGRRSIYYAAVPNTSSAPLSAGYEKSSAPFSTRYSHRVARHLVANSIKTEGARDHGALDERRERRPHHHDSRAERHHQQPQERIYEASTRRLTARRAPPESARNGQARTRATTSSRTTPSHPLGAPRTPHLVSKGSR